MQEIIPQSLLRLAKGCPSTLFVVGGSVRDFLCGYTPLSGKRDWDICSRIPVDAFEALAKNCGFVVRAVYKNTGTVKLQDGEGVEYEYSRFRSDKYVRGVHTPVEIYFTDDIALDARRRDFTANAVYYDIADGKFVDPLGGIQAIKERRLSTVAAAKKVFGEDGLRLMRLARFGAQLGFTPDGECLAGARENAALIRDISPERIFAELSAILSADKKYGVKNGHYLGLQLLSQTRVLDEILPELTLGRDMKQRADFHKYDVLEHSLRAVLYADESVRFAALLHDIGKPFCKLRDGNSHEHHKEGARLAADVLRRWKAPNKLIDGVQRLVLWHMYDFNCQTGEKKLRRFFVEHYPVLEALLLVKQADFSACTDDLSVAPTVARWQALQSKLREENAPLTLKQLAISGKDLINEGFAPDTIGGILERLLLHAVVKPEDNEKTRLLRLAKYI
ncbi:MAG: CCA tRNA nucleotidyltransferase [Clostridia bacterium]|nr:CCA tRNA nucleotidyltransferase [Clostridia bacterium]